MKTFILIRLLRTVIIFPKGKCNLKTRKIFLYMRKYVNGKLILGRQYYPIWKSRIIIFSIAISGPSSVVWTVVVTSIYYVYCMMHTGVDHVKF